MSDEPIDDSKPFARNIIQDFLWHLAKDIGDAHVPSTLSDGGFDDLYACALIGLLAEAGYVIREVQ